MRPWLINGWRHFVSHDDRGAQPGEVVLGEERAHELAINRLPCGAGNERESARVPHDSQDMGLGLLGIMRATRQRPQMTACSVQGVGKGARLMGSCAFADMRSSTAS